MSATKEISGSIDYYSRGKKYYGSQWRLRSALTFFRLINAVNILLQYFMMH